MEVTELVTKFAHGELKEREVIINNKKYYFDNEYDILQKLIDEDFELTDKAELVDNSGKIGRLYTNPIEDRDYYHNVDGIDYLKIDLMTIINKINEIVSKLNAMEGKDE